MGIRDYLSFLNFFALDGKFLAFFQRHIALILCGIFPLEMKKLPEIQRCRMQLYCFRSMTYEQIVKKKGCTQNAGQAFHGNYSGMSEKGTEQIFDFSVLFLYIVI